MEEDGSLARRRVDPRKKKKELRAQRDKAVKEFCRTMLLMAKAMHTKNKQDYDLSELYEQLKIGVKDVPLDLMEVAGEHISNNREDIAKGNVKEFMKRDYTKEIKEGLERENIRDTSEFEKVQMLITKIKRTWRYFNAVEQGDMTKKLQNMLKQYATWVHTKRELKKLEG